MRFRKSKKIFLLLSVLLHGIFFGLLILLNVASQENQDKNIFEVTTATFVSEKKQTGLPQVDQNFRGPQKKASEKAFEKTQTVNSAASDAVDAVTHPEIKSSESITQAAENTLPTLGDENAVTEGVRVLNMKEVTSSVQRTEAAIQNQIEGKIRLKILVDESGSVRKITPLNSLGYGLDEVAIQAANKLRFIPARIKTKAVALEAIYTIIFTTKHN